MNEGKEDGNPPQFRRVLVLAGGGAKGAYAFGCMQAFREAGIVFDAVAGTSVGALNALIWTTEQFDHGLELWQKLSFANVYPPKFPRWLPTRVKWVIGSGYVMLQLLWATLHQIPVPGAAFFRIMIVTFGIGFPLVVPVAATTKFAPNLLSSAGTTSTPTAWIAFLLVVFLLVETGVSFLGSGRSKGAFFFVLLLVTAWMCPAYLLVEMVAPKFVSSHSVIGLITTLTVLTGMLGPPYLFISRLMRGTLMSSAPLENTIREMVTATKCRIPCYVTTGCLHIRLYWG